MKLYADTGPKRTAQVLGDGAVAVVTFLLLWLASFLREQILGFRTAAERVESSGRSVSSGATSAGDALSDVPLVGGALRTPFDVVAEAGRDLSVAGTEAGSSIDALALWLPLLLVVLPVGLLLLSHLPRRVRWVREVAEVERLAGTVGADRLLAHRAIANRSLRDLRRGGVDAAGAFAAGDWATLARLERRALGLRDRPPAG
ncbi:hypothetical protein [Egicoccus sp. AB-alg2]|uniref:hypothetical protein n=1 Tax=Egicoccus sp. AB-alg2 TaxID=3242693 RepID=UPI00359DF3F9